MMNRAKLLKISVLLLVISFLVQAVTGICIAFLEGALSKIGILEPITEIHEYNGFVFVALVFVHLLFNWGWIRANIRGK